MADTINNLLIIGGGTAGWLTAAILAKQLGDGKNAISITLVESPDIPILGVGEGTWPNLRATLQKIGIDETEFMRECDATFKQGAEFVNWVNTPTKDVKDSYYHPLNTVFHASYDFNLSPYWLLGDAADNTPYDQAVASQARICDHGLAPKKITTPSYAAIQEYSYHLNANKFANLLRKHCTTHLNVKQHFANVTQVNQSSDGFIESVTTDSAGTISADLFLDSTGASALLIAKTLGVGWNKIDHILLNDTALAVQVPYDDEDTPISSHTIATAHDAGWTWDIGLFNRRGVGHVYSSHHTTDDKAETVLREYIGSAAKNLEIRKIPLKTGYRKEFWHKNCIAIGMAAGFVEPLEASAIYLFDAAANMIADQLPRTRKNMELVAKKFNSHYKMRIERSIDFIKLHYCISKRRDTQYWIDNCAQESIPYELQQKLEHWKTHPPTKYDFNFAWEPFNLDSYLYVLYGMKFNTQIHNNSSAFKSRDTAKRMFTEVERVSEKLIKELPKQRDLLKKVYKFGFGNV